MAAVTFRRAPKPISTHPIVANDLEKAVAEHGPLLLTLSVVLSEIEKLFGRLIFIKSLCVYILHIV